MVFGRYFRSNQLAIKIRPVGIFVGLLLAFSVTFIDDLGSLSSERQASVASQPTAATLNLEQVFQLAGDSSKNRSNQIDGSALAIQLSGNHRSLGWGNAVCQVPTDRAIFCSLTDLGIRLQI